MLRKLLIGVVLALLLVPTTAAARRQSSVSTLLMPDVTYEKRVQFTPHGPVVLNVITAPKPGGLYSLQPMLSNDAIIGREKLTDMEKRVSASATVAGVNSDLFNFGDGHPSGVVIQNGVLEHPPLGARTSIGLTADGLLHLDRVSFNGYWRGTGQRRNIGLNDPPGPNGNSLFSRAYGPTTPAVTGVVEVVLHPFPNVTANADLVGVVADVLSPSQGTTAIPPDGVVLQARGAAATNLAAEAPLGATVTVHFTLTPTWEGVLNALGGGPLIVSGGKPVFRANEAFTAEQLSPRNPRTAIGQKSDGKILLVAVDGRQPGYSVGMTAFELALAMMQLGAVNASALDAGGSTTMAFDGQLLNRPSDPGGERPLGDAWLVAYAGVYVPAVPEPVLSPNGDGVAEAETLTYRLVRPSTVSAQLVGPDKSVQTLDAGTRAAGIYTFTWAGTNADGTSAAEGAWHFTVTATDDQGQASIADRTFALNETLATLAVQPSALKLRKKGTKLVASFTLARPAAVTATVETAKGIVVRVLSRGALDTGQRLVTWNGRNDAGSLAYGGSYRVHVVASNALGRVDLYAPFTARR